MSPKITAEHLRRGAVVYVRQSSMTQVHENTESQRRQYALADTARAMGFASVEMIDDDLGKSGSGLVDRPGFARLVALVCAGGVGAVLCIEASRLARNGRDWHHLVGLCALCATLIIDPDGTYDPRLMNDRLLLGMKGTMSEYELNLLRERANTARETKAKRGELRFCLPAGYLWDELGKIDIDPDTHIAKAVCLVFRKFNELASARQVHLWFVNAKVTFPAVRYSSSRRCIEWTSPCYDAIRRLLQNPIYAGAYAFGRSGHRTRIIDGRAVKSAGHTRARDQWSVLLTDHHPGYITWEQFERNQVIMSENAHMLKKANRKSGRGGRALLTGILRCGRCVRMLRVNYGAPTQRPHSYYCEGSSANSKKGSCLSVGGIRVDNAVAERLVEALAPHAIDAALEASRRATSSQEEVHAAIERELEAAKYEAELDARRHRAVDPDKRHVARELESRWEASLERVRTIEQRFADARAAAHTTPMPDRETLLHLARDLVSVWNAPGVEMRTKQRLVHILIREVVVDRDDTSEENVVTIHWQGGVHTEVRLPRGRRGGYSDVHLPSALDVVRKLGGTCPDHTLAGTLNRMRCPNAAQRSWTATQVRELRERLEIADFDPAASRPATVSLDEAARRLKITRASVRRLIREGVLPATHLVPFAPWQIPVDALDSEELRTRAQRVISRRPLDSAALEDRKTHRLPGF